MLSAVPSVSFLLLCLSVCSSCCISADISPICPPHVLISLTFSKTCLLRNVSVHSIEYSKDGLNPPTSTHRRTTIGPLPLAGSYDLGRAYFWVCLQYMSVRRFGGRLNSAVAESCGAGKPLNWLIQLRLANSRNNITAIHYKFSDMDASLPDVV